MSHEDFEGRLKRIGAKKSSGGHPSPPPTPRRQRPANDNASQGMRTAFHYLGFSTGAPIGAASALLLGLGLGHQADISALGGRNDDAPEIGYVLMGLALAPFLIVLQFWLNARSRRRRGLTASFGWSVTYGAIGMFCIALLGIAGVALGFFEDTAT